MLSLVMHDNLRALYFSLPTHISPSSFLKTELEQELAFFPDNALPAMRRKISKARRAAVRMRYTRTYTCMNTLKFE